MKSICTAPPRYQLPCSKYGPTRPTPAPKPWTFMAANPGCPSAATPIWYSAVDEQPGDPRRPGPRPPRAGPRWPRPAVRADLAFRPRLLRQPVDGVEAVGFRPEDV